MTTRSLLAACLLVLLANGSGCSWLQRRTPLEPTPVVFAEVPSLEQVMSSVNANTDRVHTLQTRDAKLLLKGLPAVTLEMAYSQPRRFRLRAGTGFTGQELDLGNNDDLFWFWARQNPQPALFYARHELFAQSPAQALLPVSPAWVIDAVGLPHFDPAQEHQGPTVRGSGILEIRTRLRTPQGDAIKLTQVHAKYAWVLQQQMFDPSGKLIASAIASDHEYYPIAQVALPRKVALELPPAQLAFQIEMGGHAINMPLGDPDALFALPKDQFPNYPLVDLADPRLVPAAQPTTPTNVDVQIPLDTGLSNFNGGFPSTPETRVGDSPRVRGFQPR